MPYQVPILLITFNRPDHTRQVLSRILEVQPQNLYVFQDGAREGNEADLQKCAQVREVVEKLTKDTATQLHTFFSDKNLGCGPGPASAITWFFDNVEQGLVFEDDCVPHPDFFAYCELLLNKYKEDERVALIGGCNYGYKIKDGTSYDFGSGHHQTWGWASWRRVWKYFDYTLLDYSEEEFYKVVCGYYKSFRQRDYWNRVFKLVKKDQLNGSCWDYQFYFSLWRRKMFAIYPCVNLISNVGFGDDATHTNSQSNEMLSRQTAPILPLRHPESVALNRKIDDFMMRSYIIPYQYGVSGLKRFPYRVNSFVKHLVGHEGPWLKKKK